MMLAPVHSTSVHIKELPIAEEAWYNQPTPLTRDEIELLVLKYSDGLTVSHIARIRGQSRQAVLRDMHRIWQKSEMPRINVNGHPMSINVDDFKALIDAMYAQAPRSDLVPSRRDIMHATCLPGDYIDGMLSVLTDAGCLKYNGPKRRYALLYTTKAAFLMRLGVY
jgi:hypothetical protein